MRSALLTRATTHLPPAKKPTDGAWTFHSFYRFPKGHLGMRYTHPSGLLVVSSVDVVRDRGPEWHVSVTFNGGRASSEQVRAVIDAFGMRGCDEDNHVPGGKARNLWLPCNRDVGACECKDEKPIVEGDYTWRAAPEETGR